MKRRILLPVLAALAIVAPLAWLWAMSLTPASYSVMDMGSADFGGQARPETPEHAGHGGHRPGPPPRSITELVADPQRPADVRVDAGDSSAAVEHRRPGRCRLYRERQFPGP